MFSYVYLHWDNIDTLNNKQTKLILFLFSPIESTNCLVIAYNLEKLNNFLNTRIYNCVLTLYTHTYV